MKHIKRIIIFALFITAAISGSKITEAFKNNDLPVYRVDVSDKKLALTFNCEWNDDDIDAIVGLLDKYNAKATFFVVGEWAEKYPEAVKKINEHGHEIGEHSYSHKDYTTMTYEEIRNDIDKTTSVISSVTGKAPCLIRMPSGAYNSRTLSAINKYGYIPVQWSVDSIDYSKTNCEQIFKQCTENTADGDIIMMHSGAELTSTVLPRILDSLCGKYELVTVSDLIWQGN